MKSNSCGLAALLSINVFSADSSDISDRVNVVSMYTEQHDMVEQSTWLLCWALVDKVYIIHSPVTGRTSHIRPEYALEG